MATKANIIDFLLAGYNDPLTGLPLSGGTVDFTYAGTNTTAYVWDDRDKTLPTVTGRSTVTLDVYGRAEVYIDGIYKLTIYDSVGSFVEIVDFYNTTSYFPPFNAVREESTATSGQTVFTTTTAYIPSSNKSNLAVLIDGRKQGLTAYTETDANTVTFSEGLAAGQVVEFVFGFTETSNVLINPQKTTAEIEDITNNINTTGKSLGRQIVNSTTGLMLYASGPLAADTWKTFDGSVAHTPA
jgi:hypothetical protein